MTTRCRNNANMAHYWSIYCIACTFALSLAGGTRTTAVPIEETKHTDYTKYYRYQYYDTKENEFHSYYCCQQKYTRDYHNYNPYSFIIFHTLFVQPKTNEVNRLQQQQLCAHPTGGDAKAWVRVMMSRSYRWCRHADVTHRSRCHTEDTYT